MVYRSHGSNLVGAALDAECTKTKTVLDAILDGSAQENKAWWKPEFGTPATSGCVKHENQKKDNLFKYHGFTITGFKRPVSCWKFMKAMTERLEAKALRDVTLIMPPYCLYRGDLSTPLWDWPYKTTELTIDKSFDDCESQLWQAIQGSRDKPTTPKVFGSCDGDFRQGPAFQEFGKELPGGTAPDEAWVEEIAEKPPTDDPSMTDWEHLAREMGYFVKIYSLVMDPTDPSPELADFTATLRDVSVAAYVKARDEEVAKNAVEKHEFQVDPCQTYTKKGIMHCDVKVVTPGLEGATACMAMAKYLATKYTGTLSKFNIAIPTQCQFRDGNNIPGVFGDKQVALDGRDNSTKITYSDEGPFDSTTKCRKKFRNVAASFTSTPQLLGLCDGTALGGVHFRHWVGTDMLVAAKRGEDLDAEEIAKKAEAKEQFLAFCARAHTPCGSYSVCSSQKVHEVVEGDVGKGWLTENYDKMTVRAEDILAQLEVLKSAVQEAIRKFYEELKAQIVAEFNAYVETEMQEDCQNLGLNSAERLAACKQEVRTEVDGQNGKKWLDDTGMRQEVTAEQVKAKLAELKEKVRQLLLKHGKEAKDAAIVAFQRYIDTEGPAECSAVLHGPECATKLGAVLQGPHGAKLLEEMRGKEDVTGKVILEKLEVLKGLVRDALESIKTEFANRPKDEDVVEERTTEIFTTSEWAMDVDEQRTTQTLTTSEVTMDDSTKEEEELPVESTSRQNTPVVAEDIIDEDEPETTEAPIITTEEPTTTEPITTPEELPTGKWTVGAGKVMLAGEDAERRFTRIAVGGEAVWGLDSEGAAHVCMGNCPADEWRTLAAEGQKIVSIGAGDWEVWIVAEKTTESGVERQTMMRPVDGSGFWHPIPSPPLKAVAVTGSVVVGATTDGLVKHCRLPCLSEGAWEASSETGVEDLVAGREQVFGLSGGRWVPLMGSGSEGVDATDVFVGADTTYLVKADGTSIESVDGTVHAEGILIKDLNWAKKLVSEYANEEKTCWGASGSVQACWGITESGAVDLSHPLDARWVAGTGGLKQIVVGLRTAIGVNFDGHVFKREYPPKGDDMWVLFPNIRTVDSVGVQPEGWSRDWAWASYTKDGKPSTLSALTGDTEWREENNPFVEVCGGKEFVGAIRPHPKNADKRFAYLWNGDPNENFHQISTGSENLYHIAVGVKSTYALNKEGTTLYYRSTRDTIEGPSRNWKDVSANLPAGLQMLQISGEKEVLWSVDSDDALWRADTTNPESLEWHKVDEIPKADFVYPSVSTSLVQTSQKMPHRAAPGVDSLIEVEESMEVGFDGSIKQHSAARRPVRLLHKSASAKDDATASKGDIKAHNF